MSRCTVPVSDLDCDESLGLADLLRCHLEREGWLSWVPGTLPNAFAQCRLELGSGCVDGFTNEFARIIAIAFAHLISVRLIFDKSEEFDYTAQGCLQSQYVPSS